MLLCFLKIFGLASVAKQPKKASCCCFFWALSLFKCFSTCVWSFSLSLRRLFSPGTLLSTKSLNFLRQTLLDFGSLLFLNQRAVGLLWVMSGISHNKIKPTSWWGLQVSFCTWLIETPAKSHVTIGSLLLTSAPKPCGPCRKSSVPWGLWNSSVNLIHVLVLAKGFLLHLTEEVSPAGSAGPLGRFLTPGPVFRGWDFLCALLCSSPAG